MLITTDQVPIYAHGQGEARFPITTLPKVAFLVNCKGEDSYRIRSLFLNPNHYTRETNERKPTVVIEGDTNFPSSSFDHHGQAFVSFRKMALSALLCSITGTE